MAPSYRFGTFEIRPIERHLLLDGVPVPLGSRAFDVLLALIEARHRVVSKDELLDLAWHGLVVEENNLQSQVSALRKVLGHHAIATVPGLGYRFAVPVERLDGPPAIAQADRSRLTNLPVKTEDLVGREVDLRELVCMSRANRLVTVHGTGGIGKSRLAQEAARSLVPAFPDGVWCADLSSVSSPAGIAAAIARAAGFKLGDGEASSLLCDRLASRNLLLVLDNCEHVSAAVASVASSVLAAAPAVRIITTSQNALGVPGEHVVRLGTLAVPPAGSTLRQARRHGAVALLERRARAIDQRFRLTSSNLAAAIGICRHLDGIALAIEMAAARVPVMGLAALEAELGASLHILGSKRVGGPTHRRTMQAMLDWSCARLRPEVRHALRSLAAFVGGFGLESAAGAISEALTPGAGAIDILGTLVERSLVQVESTAPPRFRLLETTRLQLLDQLAGDGERDRAFERHGCIVAQLASEAEAAYWTLPGDEWLRSYLPDYENLQAAFERAHVRADAETAGAVLDALRWLDYERDSPFTMRPRMPMARDLLAAASPLAKARLLNGLSTFRRFHLEGLAPLDLARERVAAWRAVGDRRQLYLALTRLADFSAYSGAVDETDLALSEAKALEDKRLPVRMLAIHADSCASVGWIRGDPAMVRAHAAALQSLAPRIGSKRMTNIARLHFAKAAVLAGPPEQAVALLGDVAERLRASEQRALEGLARSLLCGVLLGMARYEAAREAAALALPLVIRSGYVDPFLEQVGVIAALEGCPLEAAQLLGFLESLRFDDGTVRPPAHERMAKGARIAIDRALDVEEQRRLGRAGVGLGLEQIAALASAVLE